jgi:hypothetical protein
MEGKVEIMEYIMNILTNLIQLGVLTGLGFLVNFLVAKYGNEKVKKAYTWAKIAVQAMEGTIVEPKAGEKKKAEAIKFLSEKIKMSEQDLAVLVQSAFEETIKVLKSKGLEE